MDTFWLIEMHGPAYLSARRLGGYEFCWTDDWRQAIRFFSREQGDLVMMAVRQLRGDLFPGCLVRVPCAVEHAIIDGSFKSLCHAGGQNEFSYAKGGA